MLLSYGYRVFLAIHIGNLITDEVINSSDLEWAEGDDVASQITSSVNVSNRQKWVPEMPNTTLLFNFAFGWLYILSRFI